MSAAAIPFRWPGLCNGCRRERELESRPTHAMRALCDDCAAKPHRRPSAAPAEFDALAGSDVTTSAPAASSPKLRVLDIDRMLSTDPPPVPWVVEPVLVAGCVTMLAGREGQGKSMLALALASAIGHGSSVAGLDCQPGRVLYIDAENGEREAHRRVRGLCVKSGTLVYVEAQGFNLATDIKLLEELVEEHKPSALILDSLRSLAPGLDENDSKQAEAAVRPVSRLAQTHGLPVGLLHHAGKGGHEYRGSTAIGAAVELGYTLSRHEDDPEKRTRRKLVCWKSRPAPEAETRWISMGSHDGRITLAEAEPFVVERERPRDDHVDGVLKLREQGMSIRQIAERIDVSKSSVERILKDCPTSPVPLGVGDSGTPPESGSGTGIEVSQATGTPETPGTPENGNGYHPVCSCVDHPPPGADGRCPRCFGAVIA
jgi:predicted ATP-dependent serine protease